MGVNSGENAHKKDFLWLTVNDTHMIGPNE